MRLQFARQNMLKLQKNFKRILSGFFSIIPFQKFIFFATSHHQNVFSYQMMSKGREEPEN